MFRNLIICSFFFIGYTTHTIGTTLGDELREAIEKANLSVLKGHYALTGVVRLDNELCIRNNTGQPLCDNVQIHKTREEIIGLLLRQIKTELKDIYGIDCTSDFYTPSSESDRILLAEARRQIDLIISQGIRNGDPAFVTIAIERALFAKESPQTVIMNFIKNISGIPQIEEDFNGTANLLTCALLGNTVAAQSAWQDGRFPIDWKSSYSELEARSEQQSKEIIDSNIPEADKQKKLQRVNDVQSSIIMLSNTRSLPFQYLYARSIFRDNTIDNSTKMKILESFDTGASLDYWGILYYAQLIKSTKPGTEATFSNENAIVGWHTYFANAMHRPLSQYFAVKPLLKKDGKLLPRGYIDALYAFAEMQRSEPFHLVLRSLIAKTNGKQIEKTITPSKAVEVAKAYLINYLYYLPGTRDLTTEETKNLTLEFNDTYRFNEIKSRITQDICILSTNGALTATQTEKQLKEFTDKLLKQFLENRLNERKIAEIMAIGEIVPEAKDILAFEIHSQHLGYADKTPEQRREALYSLAVEGVQAAQDLLIEDYVTEFTNNPEALNLLGNIYHFAFKGNIKAQNLLTENRGELPSLLQLHLVLNNVKGITPFKDKQTDVNNEARNLLKHTFKIINILTQPHDYSGKFVDFLSEAKTFIDETENA